MKIGCKQRALSSIIVTCRAFAGASADSRLERPGGRIKNSRREASKSASYARATEENKQIRSAVSISTGRCRDRRSSVSLGEGMGVCPHLGVFLSCTSTERASNSLAAKRTDQSSPLATKGSSVDVLAVERTEEKLHAVDPQRIEQSFLSFIRSRSNFVF